MRRQAASEKAPHRADTWRPQPRPRLERVEGQGRGVRSRRQATARRPSDNRRQQPWLCTCGGRSTSPSSPDRRNFSF